MFIFPVPSWISFITLFWITSVFCNFVILESICFNILTSVNVFLISSYNSSFSQWSSGRPSTHLGKFMFILSIGNSYKTLPKISSIFSDVKFSQSVGITCVSYFSCNFYAIALVKSESGWLEFNTIINGLFNSLSSFTTLSSGSI